MNYRTTAFLLLPALAGCGHTHKLANNPLTLLLGHRTDTGTFFVDGRQFPVSNNSLCEMVGDTTAVTCRGDDGTHFAWLDIFSWDPKTGQITKTSLGTIPGERPSEMTGAYDTTTRTLSLKGVQRLTDGTELPVRSLQTFTDDGMTLKFFVTKNGEEQMTLDIVKR
jgi:hypothetical protein